MRYQIDRSFGPLLEVLPVLQTHCSSQCSPGLEKGVIMYAWFLFTEQSTPHPIEVEQ
jgi:hypothetical protein